VLIIVPRRLVSDTNGGRTKKEKNGVFLSSQPRDEVSKRRGLPFKEWRRKGKKRKGVKSVCKSPKELSVGKVLIREQERKGVGADFCKKEKKERRGREGKKRGGGLILKKTQKKGEMLSRGAW